MRRPRLDPSALTTPAAFLLLLLAGALAPAAAQTDRVVPLVAAIQRADYEGDRPALLRLHHELAPYAEDPLVGARVRYWRGFALWRRALNGANESAPRAELIRDLELAVAEFDRAAARDSTFLDARIASGSCLLTLLFFHQRDTARVREYLDRARPLLQAARVEDPDHPRLLWVLGGSRFNAPPEAGGDQAQAVELWRRGLESARSRGSDADPLTPDWGEPELLMTLAWANLRRTTPDLDAAERYAESALALVPYWHYVRDILVPQIAAAREPRR